jgi:hypothetical protein
MKTNTLIDILRFPSKKTNNLKPWYAIIRGIGILPFLFVSKFAFYICIVIYHFGFYEAEQFRKEFAITLK